MLTEVEYPTYRPQVEIKPSTAGLGLFAGEDIAKDQLIIEYTGDRIDGEEAEKRGGEYLFEVSDDLTIDGSDTKYTARYINHSCNPNAEAEHEVTEDRVYIRAVRNILKGEEITFDYGKDFFDRLIAPRGCQCETCRGK